MKRVLDGLQRKTEELDGALQWLFKDNPRRWVTMLVCGESNSIKILHEIIVNFVGFDHFPRLEILKHHSMIMTSTPDEHETKKTPSAVWTFKLLLIEVPIS